MARVLVLLSIGLLALQPASSCVFNCRGRSQRTNVKFFSVVPNATAPQQVHVAFGETPSDAVVTWNTRETVSAPVAQFGLLQNRLNVTARAWSRLFVDGGSEQRSQLIHRARLTGLRPGTRYWYRVGSSNGSWSEVFNFVAMRTDAAFAPRLAVYGDLGLDNPQSLPRLKSDMEKGMYDAVLHVGDFAYDMATDDAQVGDAFMRTIEPIAARLPYMTCPGNHENHYNFSNYRARFSMPGSAENMFYSFDMGPVHFVAISTEFYFYIYYGISQVQTQYNWLLKDLENANKPENREKRPWIIMYGHRPLYCSNNDGDCGFMAAILRDGVPLVNWFGIEPLLEKYGIDLAIWAHEHSYERMWPVLRNVVMNGTTPGKPYLNPRATVHVVTGSAGCKERHDTFGPRKTFTAFRSTDYGYSRMHIINSTHLTFDQVSDDQHGKIIDKFVLIREKHTPFN